MSEKNKIVPLIELEKELTRKNMFEEIEKILNKKIFKNGRNASELQTTAWYPKKEENY